MKTVFILIPILLLISLLKHRMSNHMSAKHHSFSADTSFILAWIYKLHLLAVDGKYEIQTHFLYRNKCVPVLN
jgi:hypothetical protein